MVLIAINPLTVLLTLLEVCHSAIFTKLQSTSTDLLFVTLLPTLGNSLVLVTPTLHCHRTVVLVLALHLKQAEESFGQVYTSGTNEFGDFKVGNFVTIFNRTGAISFVGTVSISELSSIKIVGGAITITGFSDDDNLGGTFASDALLPTQASVRDYISNNLGPYLNQPYSTNAVPSALVQLTSSGKINIDQIPALRPFNITSVTSQAERLAIEDANAGDIAIETTATTFSVAPADNTSSNEYITITGHGTNTGDQLTYTAGAVQQLLVLQLVMFTMSLKLIMTLFKLAATESNANSGNAINLQSQGTGTQSFETQGTAISYILENDLESQFLSICTIINQCI